MKGDFTRLTFQPANHFSAVRQQQGRVQVDADWNEQVDIQAHRDRVTTRDVVGAYGIPAGEAGLGLDLLGLVQTIRSVSFSRPDVGLVVGDGGTLVRATSGSAGVSWYLFDPVGAFALRGVFVLDDVTAWAVGDRAGIIAFDKSAAWTAQSAPAGLTAALRGVHFVDDQHGWAVGDRATIIATTGGGKGLAGTPSGWTKQLPPGDVRVTLRAVYFVDAQTGWAVGDRGTIITTRDGGATWVRQNPFPQGSPLTVNNLRGAYFHDTEHGFVVGDGGTILGTSNGGRNWSEPVSPVATTLRAVSFANPRLGWIVGDNATILVTGDSGTSWRVQTAPTGVTGNLRGVSFVDEANGYAAGDGGTVVTTTDGGKTWVLEHITDPQLVITEGRIYVDGILCENETATALQAQPDPTAQPIPDLSTGADGNPNPYLFYLDVWERHLTALDTPSIREVALGGPDTATRTKVVWQVKWQTVDPESDVPPCGGPGFVPNDVQRSGSLAARAAPASGTDSPCLVPPGGGYRRLENQLYRVEVHQRGEDGVTTYKWSRDNASVAARLERVDADQLSISGAGPDAVAAFDGAPWVEITDEERTLAGVAGDLMALTSANAGKLVPTDLSMLATPGTAPIVRRWDGVGSIGSGWVELEDGVQISFESPEDTHRTGDYWTIPARSLTATVEWPVDEGGPTFQPPAGIIHHYAPLAEVSAGQGWEIRDCRPVFSPLIETLPAAVHITDVSLRNPAAGALANEDMVSFNNLTDGIDVTFDRPVSGVSILTSCSLTVEVPFPLTSADVQDWGDTLVGYQPIELVMDIIGQGEDGPVTTVTLHPRQAAFDFLLRVLNRLSRMAGYPDRVLVRILLRGNFIWSAADPSVWLDGETFGVGVVDSEQVVLRDVDGRLSGDGKRASDFRMSFFVRLPQDTRG